MNSQTAGYRKVNLSTKVVKGAPVPKGPSPDVLKGGALTLVSFESTKGQAVNSSKERANSKTPGGKDRKPWKGHGDPLGRKRDK
jgi:hypothetical protein